MSPDNKKWWRCGKTNRCWFSEDDMLQTAALPTALRLWNTAMTIGGCTPTHAANSHCLGTNVLEVNAVLAQMFSQCNKSLVSCQNCFPYLVRLCWAANTTPVIPWVLESWIPLSVESGGLMTLCTLHGSCAIKITVASKQTKLVWIMRSHIPYHFLTGFESRKCEPDSPCRANLRLQCHFRRR